MNEIVYKFLLAGNKFIPEMHLRQPGFTYTACRPFTKNKERIQTFKETADTSYIYKNELDKACFQHDPKYDGYQRGLTFMIYKLFEKKSASLTDESVAGRGVANNEIKQNLQLAKELHKPIIRKIK